MDAKTTGRFIAELRKQKGYTQKELAEKIIPMVEAAKDKCDSCKTIASLSHLIAKTAWRYFRCVGW